jgi:sedoheptulokinase
MSLCTIGIDIGSTSTKGVLYHAEEQRVLRVASDFVRPVIAGLPRGYYEEDPGELKAAVFSIIRALAEHARQHHLRPKAICFTGQMHGGLLVDDRIEPISNFVTWQDKRGDERVEGESIASRVHAEMSETAQRSIGTDIHTGFLGITHRWWHEQGVVPQGSKIIGIYEWLASTLCGRLHSDRSSVAAWGLYDIEHRQISEEALAACRVDISSMPEVLDVGEHVGYTKTEAARELGLESGIMLIAGMGDTQASYIGSGCTKQDILLNFGTGSQLMLETERFARYWGTDTRYLSNNSYLVVAPTLAGGKAYSILADFYLDVLRSFGAAVPEKDALYARMNELASKGTSEVRFEPYFLGSRTHGEDMRASILGLDAANFTVGNLTRSLLEGMILEVKEPYDRLPESLRRQSGIIASGNGMRRNPALRKIASEAFGLPLRMTEFEEEAALGAAIVAARSISQ